VGVPSRPCAEVELRVVSRDDGGIVLYRELLPLRGLEVTTGAAQAQRQAGSHEVASQSRRPVFPSELHLLSDAAGGVTGQEGLPVLFAVSPKVRVLRAFLHACCRETVQVRGTEQDTAAVPAVAICFDTRPLRILPIPSP
jgi:hypothetical protein